MLTRSELLGPRTASARALLALALLALALFVAAPSCMQTRYVIQAGLGQAELWSLARNIDEVIADPNTDERTRVLLNESKVIMDYAKQHGYSRKGNYNQFVEVDRGQVVWFLAAAQPLKLEAEIWNFPLVGSFPYLGWFEYDEALQIRKRLKARGLDVYMRPVHAYSTGGWLDDPILSTMLSSEDDAFRYLSNILLHELTHANLFVEDQATFNESIASFVGDTMAKEYLTWRFGADSEEVLIYSEEAALSQVQDARFVAAHAELEALYGSDKSDATKSSEKQRITLALQYELDLAWQPNNASLMGFKVYNTGRSEFEALYRACGTRWAPFFAAVKSLKEVDFGEAQLEEIGPVVSAMMPRCQATARADVGRVKANR